MVRKRSRKFYDEDDNDTDSDFGGDSVPDEPATKKYSLRQRKRPMFTEDFDYEVEEDEDDEEYENENVDLGPVTKLPSEDDEDYELELDDEADDSEFVSNSTYINSYEPEVTTLPGDVEELIDFEDIIRADIVVNKNRIDYDNIIQKTEIKIQPTAKRGRKPKAKVESKVVTNDDDFKDEDDPEAIDCGKLLETQLQENDDSLCSDDLPLITRKISVEKTESPEAEETQLSENNDEKTVENNSNLPAAKPESPKLNEAPAEAEAETNEVTAPTEAVVENETSSSNIEAPIASDEDDDVVLLEDKSANVVIVLEDD